MNPTIILFVAYVLLVAYVGYALGKSDLRIRPALTAVTVVVGVILHGMWKLVLPHEGIDWIARAVAQPLHFPTLAAGLFLITCRHFTRESLTRTTRHG